MANGNPRLGPIGIWSMELRFGDHGAIDEAAAELDELGYAALWIPGGIDDAVLGDIDRLLSATRRMTLATGIVNMWKQTPAQVAAWWKSQSADRQARVMLGLGISHGPIIGEDWQKPITVSREYLEGCKANGLPPEAMCVAALGPKMLELARDYTCGAHPYLVTPEHSAIARKILGPGKLLAQEQGVVLESDPAKARELARGALQFYCTLPNYVNNWIRLGFTQEDAATMSDRLIDGLFAWGSAEKIAERVKAHQDAGADHVCLQVVTGSQDMSVARAAWRELAAVLL